MKRSLSVTPSSNTALEPLTSAMVSSLPGVSAHFSRFTVTEISLRDASLRQFDDIVRGGSRHAAPGRLGPDQKECLTLEGVEVWGGRLLSRWP